VTARSACFKAAEEGHGHPARGPQMARKAAVLAGGWAPSPVNCGTPSHAPAPPGTRTRSLVSSYSEPRPGVLEGPREMYP
jgi:hypothetical protein